MQIEKNIPIPLKIGQIAEQMEAGDSVLCDTYIKAMRLRDALRHRKIEYKTRKTPDGVRVWRLS